MAEKIRKEKDCFEAGPLEADVRGLVLGRRESRMEERHPGGPERAGALADVDLAGEAAGPTVASPGLSCRNPRLPAHLPSCVHRELSLCTRTPSL